MTVAEVLKQANALTPSERKELVIRLVETLDVAQPQESEQPAHWGEALVKLVRSMDMSDWESLEIDDPVEWVKQLRREDEDRLKSYWGR